MIAGDTFTFTVDAYGVPAPAYQWFVNDVPISGATQATLALPNVDPTEEGRYSVLVSNSSGTVASNAVGLRVLPADMIPQSYDNDVVVSPQPTPPSPFPASCLTSYLPKLTDPIKLIDLNFNVFQKSDASGNWPDTPQTHSGFAQIVGWVNAYYSLYLCDPSDPCPGTQHTMPTTFVQFRLKNVYFYQDDALWNSANTGALQTVAFTQHPTSPCQLNVYFTQAHPGASGWALPPTTDMNYNQYIHIFGSYTGAGANFGFAGTLAHELGHTLDLFHTYVDGCCPESCNTSDCDYLSDVFCPPTNPCLQTGDWNCDPALSSNTCTNNMMGATYKACFFSDLQICKIHRALLTKSVGRYIRPVAYYTFDNVFDPGFDDSGNGHHGMMGAATLVTQGNCTALNFLPDNNVPEFSIPDAQDLNVTGAMTGLAWIRVRGSQSADNNPGCRQGTIFSKGGVNWFQIDPNNDAIVFQNEGSGTELARSDPLTIPLLTWTQVAFVRETDNSTIRFYMNGLPVGVDYLNHSPFADTDPLMVGNYGFGDVSTACEFNGDIDDLKIFNVALSDAAILREYDLSCFHCLPLNPLSYITPFCFGDGSGAPCPCGNTGAPNSGCANSVSTGAQLTGSGEAHLPAGPNDTFSITATNIWAGGTAYGAVLLSSSEGSAQPFGDGLLCGTGAAQILYTWTIASQPVGVVTLTAPGNSQPNVGFAQRMVDLATPLTHGETRIYTVRYRDYANFACTGISNYTNGVRVLWVQP